MQYVQALWGLVVFYLEAMLVGRGYELRPVVGRLGRTELVARPVPRITEAAEKKR